MTYEQLLEKFPACAKDIGAAYYAGPAYPDSNYTDCFFRVTVEPMSAFEHDARVIGEWANGAEDEHEERVQAIVELLKAGEPQLPIFTNEYECGGWVIDTERAIVEGMHRIVAFHKLGLKTVTVVAIDEDATEAAAVDPDAGVPVEGRVTVGKAVGTGTL